MALIEPSAQFTPREVARMDYEKEMFEKQAVFNLEIKKLEVEVLKEEARWASWFKIPLVIVKLPVYMLFGIGYCIMAAKGNEPSENFWRFIK